MFFFTSKCGHLRTSANLFALNFASFFVTIALIKKISFSAFFLRKKKVAKKYYIEFQI